MQTAPTPLSTNIFSRIQALDGSAVFLARMDGRPVCSVGRNRSPLVEFDICLYADGAPITIGPTEDFALLMDGHGPEGSPRFVLYRDGTPAPAVEYTRDDEDKPWLSGFISVTIHEPNGTRVLTAHAVFSSQDDASLIIDASPVLQRHLQLCGSLIRKERTYASNGF